ncbi:helix-turn-helix transcriptional regulator [candidate division TA06 bacterium]|uniref:Helix-turn-helix transcriptional regulator n=1 Tax=candidate division TA06 bacterium TaxID=2250710 RepID=A0A933ML26_UNCT6|nr:helix-turn-helix transcriptional regulator [candidate division TA06 bacterium]
MSEILKLVGDNTRAIRKSQNLSQEKLAERAGVDYRYIGFIEQGRVNPTLKSLEKIAAALKINFAVLFINIETRKNLVENHINLFPKMKPMQKRIYGQLRKADPGQLKLFEYIIKGLMKRKRKSRS